MTAVGSLRPLALLALLASSLPGACAGRGSQSASPFATSVSNEDYAVQYDLQDIRAASDGSGLPVVMAGAAFPGLAEVDLGPRLLATMQSAAPHSRPAFVPASAAPARQAYRLVLVFDAAPGLTARRVCLGETGSGVPATGRLEVFAVCCRGVVPMSQATGRARAAGPDDPALRQLFKALLATLFSDAPVVRPYHGYPGGLL